MSTDDPLHTLFDRSPIGMYRSRRDGSLVYWNPALARILGYSAEEMAHVNVVRDLHTVPGERERLLAKYGAHGMTEGVVVTWRHKAGHHIKIRLFGHVSAGEDGPTFDASVMDITASERQREELESVAQILDAVVNQVSSIWWVMDRDLVFVRSGGRIYEILGNDPRQVVGHTLHQALALDPTTDAAQALDAHRRALAGEVVRYSSEYRGRLFETTIAPFKSGGDIAQVIGTSVDVTAVRALESRMVDAQRAESLGVLAGGLAHDFNNLLAAILGNADLALRDVKPGAPGRSPVENIRVAGLRAAELTDQLLAYAGRGNVSSDRVNPKPLVEELLRITHTPENIAIHVDLPDTLALRGDAAQVRQVVLNLVTNAREALGERGGSIAITARLVQRDGTADPDDVIAPSAGTYLELEVTDDGPGMDRDTRRRIFDPFFTTKATGHGLGLAAVLGIVRSHHGGVRVRSTPGSGTTFQIAWPATTTPYAMPAVFAPTKTILVVDDEELVRDVVVRMIQDLGYGAFPAQDGFAALDAAAATPFDAALVDLTMPRMSGADLVTQLRQKYPALKIILCTGYDRDRRGPVVADGYLAKPFRMEVLEQLLRNLLA